MKEEIEPSLELKRILELARPYSLTKEPVEQRAARNALLRQRLAEASDATVAESALRMGNLARREFKSRLKEGGIFPLEPLFEAVERLASWGIARRRQIEEYNLIRVGVVRSAASVPIESVVGIFGQYLNSVVGRDTYLLADVFNTREDREDIIAQVLNSIPKGPDSELHFSDTEMRLELVRQRAAELKLRNKV